MGSNIGEYTKLGVAIISLIVTAAIGAVIVAQMEGANLISGTSALNATFTTLSSDYIVWLGLLIVIIVVGVAVVIVPSLRNMGGN